MAILATVFHMPAVARVNGGGIDLSPITEMTFIADTGSSFSGSFSYRPSALVGNNNTCVITVNAPVDLTFAFSGYIYNDGKKNTLPSSNKKIKVSLQQTISFDGLPLSCHYFNTRLMASSGIVSPQSETLEFILPGKYVLTFEGFGNTIPILSLTTVQPNTTILAGELHTMTISITAQPMVALQDAVDFDGADAADNSALVSIPGTVGHNSVSTFTPISNDEASGVTEIAYLDGLGRMEERVLAGFCPNGKDLSFLTEYDAFGRVWRQWRPGAMQTSDGGFSALPDCKAAATQSNDADSEPFSLLQYEPSPLERTTEEYGAGLAWHAMGRSVIRELSTNRNDNAGRKCRVFSFDGNSSAAVQVSSQGYYPSGSLLINGTTDEDEHEVLVFTDASGRTILSRTICSGGNADTYYVCDGLGRLRAVLPPELSAQVTDGPVSQELLSKYAFLYTYDDNGLLSAKKLPGADWITYEYDVAERLKYSQDGEQRKRSEKTFFLYDIFGRVCIKGIGNESEFPSLPALFGNNQSSACRYSGVANSWMGYENASVFLDNVVVTDVYFYDNYDFLQCLQTGLPDSLPAYGTSARNAQGLLTGTARLRLHEGSDISYDYELFRYDYLSRVVHTERTNIVGGYDVEDILPNMAGLPERKKLLHKTTSANVRELYTYTYDHSGRLTETKHQVNSKQERVTAQFGYNDIGLKAWSQLGNQLFLRTFYKHNVRGWLTDATGLPFSEKLYYNSRRGVDSQIYSGALSAVEWRRGMGTWRGFDYEYDEMSRLSSASYTEGGSPCSKYDTTYGYDLNGNVLYITRNGKTDTSEYEQIDDLDFNYDGNHLTSVSDYAAEQPCFNGTFHFIDGADEDDEYDYDLNGNVTRDLNKDITEISYNFLNLPQSITYANGNKVSYTYSSDGHNLKTEYYVMQAGQLILDVLSSCCYFSNVEYMHNSIARIHFDGGYVSHYVRDPVYHYFLKDHLGSIRIVANETGTNEQNNDYYPFGALTGESSGGDVQPLKYNGKELDRVNGIDWSDYGSRMLDHATGRWNSIDAMCEKYYSVSPYVYCFNNPIMFIDPDGEEPTAKEAAYIAEHVYGKTDELIGGWQPYYMNSMSNGLQYGIYQREMKNGDVEYVLAFAGTNDLKDVQQDIIQFVGIASASQYGDAVSLGRRFASLYDGYEKTIIGHSLGGGLATAAAMSTNIPAITFNPAAMTEHTKQQIGIINSNGANITNYVVFGEPLSVIQNMTGMHLPGSTNYLYVKSTGANPFANTFNAHKISTIKYLLPQ